MSDRECFGLPLIMAINNDITFVKIDGYGSDTELSVGMNDDTTVRDDLTDIVSTVSESEYTTHAADLETPYSLTTPRDDLRESIEEQVMTVVDQVCTHDEDVKEETPVTPEEPVVEQIVASEEPVTTVEEVTTVPEPVEEPVKVEEPKPVEEPIVESIEIEEQPIEESQPVVEPVKADELIQTPTVQEAPVQSEVKQKKSKKEKKGKKKEEEQKKSKKDKKKGKESVTQEWIEETAPVVAEVKIEEPTPVVESKIEESTPVAIQEPTVEQAPVIAVEAPKSKKESKKEKKKKNKEAKNAVVQKQIEPVVVPDIGVTEPTVEQTAIPIDVKSAPVIPSLSEKLPTTNKSPATSPRDKKKNKKKKGKSPAASPSVSPAVSPRKSPRNDQKPPKSPKQKPSKSPREQPTKSPREKKKKSEPSPRDVVKRTDEPDNGKDPSEVDTKQIEHVKELLTKLTRENYSTIVPQFQEIKYTTQTTLDAAIDVIFEVSISQPKYSDLLAMLCRDLKETPDFQRILLEKVQHEFAKHSTQDYFAKIKEILKEKDKAKQRRRRMGNNIFIGELYTQQVMPMEMFCEIVHELVVKPVHPSESDLEELFDLITLTGKKLNQEASTDVMNQYFNRMNELNTDKEYSKSIREMMGELLVLRRQWPIKIDVNAPPPPSAPAPPPPPMMSKKKPEPVVEEPVKEEPVVEEPVKQEPVKEEPIVEPTTPTISIEEPKKEKKQKEKKKKKGKETEPMPEPGEESPSLLKRVTSVLSQKSLLKEFAGKLNDRKQRQIEETASDKRKRQREEAAARLRTSLTDSMEKEKTLDKKHSTLTRKVSTLKKSDIQMMQSVGPDVKYFVDELDADNLYFIHFYMDRNLLLTYEPSENIVKLEERLMSTITQQWKLESNGHISCRADPAYVLEIRNGKVGVGPRIEKGQNTLDPDLIINQNFNIVHAAPEGCKPKFISLASNSKMIVGASQKDKQKLVLHVMNATQGRLNRWVFRDETESMEEQNALLEIDAIPVEEVKVTVEEIEGEVVQVIEIFEEVAVIVSFNVVDDYINVVFDYDKPREEILVELSDAGDGTIFVELK
jgi:hypothetical protein